MAQRASGDYQVPPVLQPPFAAVVQVRVYPPPATRLMLNALVLADVAVTVNVPEVDAVTETWLAPVPYERPVVPSAEDVLHCV